MDRIAQSDLSLGFGSSSHALPPRIAIADDSITLQIDSSFRPSSNPMPPVPLQLLEQRFDDTGSRSRVVVEDDDVENDDDDDDQREEHPFILLGHPMKLKRCRGSNSVSSLRPCKRFLVDSGIEGRRASVKAWGNQSIEEADPEIYEFMEKEKQRQFRGIELIASENFVCRAVMEALGSHLTNKYSEGMPGARYYTGNQFIDHIEILCQERALKAFGLDHENWGVNVQPYSCTSANFAVFNALLMPGERIMGLDSPSGGHMSHGYYTPGGKKVSAASIFFQSFPYKVDPRTGYIDYDKLEEKALDYRPKLLICGGSSYPRDWEFSRFRHVADKCGAVLMFDMAQISGLVAAKEAPYPFEYCDIVTSTTHKSLRGPRGGIIFYRRGLKPKKQSINLNHNESNIQYDFEEKINFSVFPSLQGGPHNNHIAALAVALKQAASPEYKVYMRQVKRNAKALEKALLSKSCKLVTGGTDNHLLLWDLTSLGLTGKVYEKVCEMCHITVNKVAIFNENGVISPGGVRIGSPAMTSRGCLESDFEKMAGFLYRAAQIASAAQGEHGKLQKEPLKSIYHCKEIADLRSQVEAFASQFAMPAYDM